MYPPAPHVPRIQFLTYLRAASDLGGGRSFLEALTGERDAGDLSIAQPTGVAAVPGYLWVCDGARMLVLAFDLTEKTLRPVANPQDRPVNTPSNCAATPDGQFLITDRRGKGGPTVPSRLLVGTPAEGLLEPFDVGEEVGVGAVAADSTRLWVADQSAGKILVYDRASGAFLYSFPEVGRDSVRLQVIAGVAVGGGAVYVSDAFQGLVHVFSEDGQYLRTVGSYGNRLGQLARPKGVAVDRNGVLYVVDAAFQNVQLFNEQGQLLMVFGGGGTAEFDGHMSVPNGIALDYDNLDFFRPWVAEGFNLRYLIYVANQFGPEGVGVYGFVGPDEDSGGGP